MVHRVRDRCVWFWSAVVLVAMLAGCVTANESADNPNGDDEAICKDGDCVQPPIRRAELQGHLIREQPRILKRHDYLEQLPPPVSEIIYGPLPQGEYREGPQLEGADGEPFDGQLNWHRVEFDDVYTDDADHDSLRGRDVSGAQCMFARKPNRLTAIFALLVMHHPDRGDVLYFGGPHQHVTRIDTVPITDHHPSRMRVDTDSEVLCAFRDDQNRHGALIVPFEYNDVPAPSNGPHWAVFTLDIGEVRHNTGETTTVPRTTGTYGDRVVQVQVPLRKYDRPRIEFVDTFTTAYDAVVAADEQVRPGDFRLRPEFVYPKMPYLSYLNTGKEEFCPRNVDCETPPKHMSKDEIPPLDPPDMVPDDAEAEATDGE